jgi:hypothetical protein
MLFNNLFNNSLILWGIFTGTAVILGYFLCYSIWYKSDSKNKINFINTNIVASLDDTENTDIEALFQNIENTDIVALYQNIENTTIEASLDDIENTTIEASLDTIENTSLNTIENTNIEASLNTIDSEIIAQTIPNNTSLDLAIRESKIHEIIRLYSEEMYENEVSLSDLTDLVNSFEITNLLSSDFNETILTIINYWQG